MIALRMARGTQRNNFRMCAGIEITNRSVLAGCNDLVTDNDYRSDGNLTCRTGLLRLAQRMLHEIGVYSHSIVDGGLPEMS